MGKLRSLPSTNWNLHLQNTLCSSYEIRILVQSVLKSIPMLLPFLDYFELCFSMTYSCQA